MKRNFIFWVAMVLVIVAGGIGCKKKTETPTYYIVSGLKDVQVVQNGDTTLNVAMVIAYKSGPHETLSLATDTLPAGITVAQPTASGTPDFTANFSFHINVATAGTYPVSIRATSATAGTKTYKFNVVVVPATFFYTLNNLPDVSLPQYTDTTIVVNLGATFTSGAVEGITIVPATVPGGVSFAPASLSGTPSFSGAFNMHVVANSAGTFPVTIKASSPASGNHLATFNLVIAPNSNCAGYLAGNYRAYDACEPAIGDTGYVAQVVKTSTANQVKIPLDFATLTADINCADGTFTTRPTTSPNVRVTAGTGTFTATTITVTYTIMALLDTTLQNTCTTTLNR